MRKAKMSLYLRKHSTKNILLYYTHIQLLLHWSRFIEVDKLHKSCANPLSLRCRIHPLMRGLASFSNLVDSSVRCPK